MSNRRVWVTKDGRAVKIMNMSDNHLLNAYRMSMRMITNREFRSDFIKDFAAEISRRGLLGRPLPKRELKLIKRRATMNTKTTKKGKKYTVLRRSKSYESPTESDTSVSQESTLGATSY